MDLLWILVTLLSLTSRLTLAQLDDWNVQNLDQDNNMDNLFRYFYNSSNDTLDLGKMNLTQLQDNIHEKMSTLNLSGTDLDALFNFNDVALTPLGQLTAWMGDRFYPVIIYGVIFGSAVALIYAIFVLVGFVSSYKLTMLGLITDAINNAHNILTDSATLNQNSSTNIRVGRGLELLELANQVYSAFEVYSSIQ